MLSVVKMLLKGEAEGCALNSHGNYIVDHGKSWKHHGIVVLNLCGNPDNSAGFALGVGIASENRIVIYRDFQVRIEI